MGNDENKRKETMLDKAAQAMRDMTVPDGPSPEELRTVLATLIESTAAPKKRSIIQRIRAMKPRTRIAAAAAAACVIAVVALLAGMQGRSAFAQTIRQLKEAEGLLIEMTSYQWEQDESEPTKVLAGKIWRRGDRVFMDLPDRKSWVVGRECITYFPEGRRVWIRSADVEDSPMAGAFSVDAVIAQLESLGLTKLPEDREVIDGREYSRITFVGDAEPPDPDVDMVFYVAPERRRLDYVGYRIASGPHKGRFYSWMKYVYNPQIDDAIFEPVYPADVTVEREPEREHTEDIVTMWRKEALVVAAEPGGMEVGLFEVWLAPDGLLTLHLYQYRGMSGAPFPEEVFAKEELTKGGFTAKEWHRTPVILECRDVVVCERLGGIPLLSHVFGFPGKGPPLREYRWQFYAPQLLSDAHPKECILHVWTLRQPATAFHWRKGYRQNKDNFAYLTLKVPVPQKACQSPSEHFIRGLVPPNPKLDVQQAGFRAWLLERNAGPEEALALLNEQPIDTQHKLAWRKLRLLKKLGRQDEIDGFLRVHIPWMRQHDSYHEHNVPHLLERFAGPDFKLED